MPRTADRDDLPGTIVEVFNTPDQVSAKYGLVTGSRGIDWLVLFGDGALLSTSRQHIFELGTFTRWAGR